MPGFLRGGSEERVAIRSCASGLTLLEMFLVLSIFSVLLGALTMSFVMSRTSYLSGSNYVYVQQQVRQAFDEMVNELRDSGGVVAAGNQLDFQIDLGYDLPAPCPPNALCWGAQDQNGIDQVGWSVRYRLANGTQLVREILDEGGVVQPGTRVLANDVDQLVFDYTGGTINTVSIQLGVRYSSPHLPGGSIGTIPAPLVTTVQLRNT